MSSFNYKAYADAIQFIVSSPNQMDQSLKSLEQQYNLQKTSEETKAHTNQIQISKKKSLCLKQYDEIKQAIEAIGIHELPPQPRPIASQLFSDDALASQNNIAKEIKKLIDAYQQDVQQEQQRKRAQQAAKEKAEAEAREKAAIEAKKREEDRIKAQKEAALQQQLDSEKERKQREELQKKLKHLIPAGIALVIILVIILLNR